MGLKIALKEVYKRFRWSVPDENDPCLTAPAAPISAPGDEEDEDDPESTRQSPPPPVAAAPASNLAGNVIGQQQKPVQDGKTREAMADEETPIAPGADPARNPGLVSPGSKAYLASTSRQMPDTQVDAGAFWSTAALKPNNPYAVVGSDGEALPAPSLGYALPNDRLERLDRVGLGNSRAARALRRTLASSPAVALPNAEPPLQMRVAAELANSLKPVTARLDKISKITDPESQQAALRKLLKDLPALSEAIMADDSLAKVLQPDLIKHFIAGLTAKK